MEIGAEWMQNHTRKPTFEKKPWEIKILMDFNTFWNPDGIPKHEKTLPENDTKKTSPLKKNILHRLYCCASCSHEITKQIGKPQKFKQ